ncbi:hypothetical protein A2574_02470 [Candidatus Shapirobacteria bacterium RIFOXYD1_FULL_38_32]|uniref:DUF8173 domain-containing protein n=3 Tax=Candidatus Shapironibacteriota TaxID=1752721 RepID=A0A0G0N1P2_9BACT|nr:MAG: hypothetical protein US90_C0004G0023 [Candidatus Shapirobacteria bacterium GW2011_GWE2_38_30]KKQ91364.1 MAG: hypothetical protein UT14_C0014G0015 [Candidatus Shapirobacteria bacterium GW2011_GWE1_38_92]OGL56016.1 MAG: hypothetical protein A2195_01570 [Candidatus Shapirobacteria bacterium RIFOXYA1_FULL_39_17]OGL56219.1 MAG: hypothetical protein A2410_00175 [Candidatus Shapirobacteria bacterium RIFOXYC1_FULL_38_24]OGL56425.1 MAG: hypothetical protein A2367_01830 [Candidatus Shapirobacteri
MKNIIKNLVFTLILFLISANPARAMFFQSGENINLPSDQVYDESVLIAGSQITINSTINGDLYCAGRDILINAQVNGSIFCVGQNIKISGIIQNNLFAAGQNIITDASVSNLTTLGQSLTVQPAANISQDAILAGQDINLSGTFGRDLTVAGENFTLNTAVVRHVYFYGQNINLQPESSIAGNLDYYIPQDIQVNLNKELVAGTISAHRLDTPTTPKQPIITPVANFVHVIYSIISFLIIGLVLLSLNPKRTLSIISIINTRSLVAFLVGFAVLILTPFAFIILLITVIGIPLAFLILFVYIIAIITATVYSSLSFGQMLVHRFNLSDKYFQPTYYLLIGLPVLWLIFNIPFVGWFIAMVSFFLGLGAFFLSFLPSSTHNK